MKSLIAAILTALAATAAHAEYERAYLVSDEPSGSYEYRKCSYQTYTGLTFQITVRGTLCPHFIYFDPQTGRFRQ